MQFSRLGVDYRQMRRMRLVAMTMGLLNAALIHAFGNNTWEVFVLPLVPSCWIAFQQPSAFHTI